LDTLNVSTRCGANPRSDQIRCTVAELTPTRLAIMRHDQCLAPSGVVVEVNCTIAVMVSSGIEGLAAPTHTDLLQPGKPVLTETLTPGPHRHRCHPDFLGNPDVGFAISSTLARNTG
jgi:hypothetical protein